jgi:hypothetical protein
MTPSVAREGAWRRGGFLAAGLATGLALLAGGAPIGAAEAAGEIDLSVSGLDENACKPYFVERGVTFGSYGSLLYQNFTTSADDDTAANQPAVASLSELFVYLGYRFDEHWVFNSSFGIQDALAGADDDGQATVEFAYVDYSDRKEFGARGGLVLLPLGFLNERHEMNSFLGTLRPRTELKIIPTTWREAGGGVYGAAGPVEWRAFLTTGLDAAGFTAEDGVAGGRSRGPRRWRPTCRCRRVSTGHRSRAGRPAPSWWAHRRSPAARDRTCPATRAAASPSGMPTPPTAGRASGCAP